jgi:cysteine desulfurase/selenocysteine lyase
VLDETDSGLDIDALNTVAAGVNTVSEGTDMGVLIITHYQRILHIVQPQFVHIMFEGRIVKEGGPSSSRCSRRRATAGSATRSRRPLYVLAVPTSSEFPTLAREGLVYLDTAATSQTVRPALEAMDRYYETYRASIHRGIYAIASEATDAYELARERVARFTGSTPGRDRLHQERRRRRSTSSRTPGGGRTSARRPRAAHADGAPRQHRPVAAARLPAAYIPMFDDGQLDLEAFDALLEQGPKLVAVAHVSNVVGTIKPVEVITERATRRGAWCLSTGAQAVPSMPVDVAEIDADFYVWTGTRPTARPGIGVRARPRELLEAMPPFLGGGT